MCIFCAISEDKKIRRFGYWFAIRDLYPVVKDHTLFISQRHVSNADDLTDEEWSELFPAIKSLFEGRDFNLGINRGSSAGQTIFHVHVHVFPRVQGDQSDPRGGVRNFKTPLIDWKGLNEKTSR